MQDRPLPLASSGSQPPEVPKKEDDILVQAREQLEKHAPFVEAMAAILFMKTYALSQKDRVSKIQAAEDRFLATLTTSQNASMRHAVKTATQKTIPVASQATGSLMGFTLGTSLHKVLDAIEPVMADAKFQDAVQAVLTTFHMEHPAKLLERLIKEVECLRVQNAELKGVKATGMTSTATVSTALIAPVPAKQATATDSITVPTITMPNDNASLISAGGAATGSAIVSLHGKTPTVATRATMASTIKNPASEKDKYQTRLRSFLSPKCYWAIEIAVKKYNECKRQTTLSTTVKTVSAAANDAVLLKLEDMIFNLMKDHFAREREGSVAVINRYPDLLKQFGELNQLISSSLSDDKLPVQEVKGVPYVDRAPCIDIVYKAFLYGYFLPKNTASAVNIVAAVDPRRAISALAKAKTMDPSYISVSTSTDTDLPSRVNTPNSAAASAMPPPPPRSRSLSASATR